MKAQYVHVNWICLIETVSHYHNVCKVTAIIYKNFKQKHTPYNEYKANFVWKQHNFKTKDTNGCQFFCHLHGFGGIKQFNTSLQIH
jgi:hypothetical protein